MVDSYLFMPDAVLANHERTVTTVVTGSDGWEFASLRAAIEWIRDNGHDPAAVKVTVPVFSRSITFDSQQIAALLAAL